MHHYLLNLINGGGPLCTIQRLIPICSTLLLSVAFNFNLRRYNAVGRTALHAAAAGRWAAAAETVLQGGADPALADHGRRRAVDVGPPAGTPMHDMLVAAAAGGGAGGGGGGGGRQAEEQEAAGRVGAGVGAGDVGVGRRTGGPGGGGAGGRLVPQPPPLPRPPSAPSPAPPPGPPPSLGGGRASRNRLFFLAQIQPNMLRLCPIMPNNA